MIVAGCVGGTAGGFAFAAVWLRRYDRHWLRQCVLCCGFSVDLRHVISDVMRRVRAVT